MSEIKFACPHCGQHIACNRDYADMCILCPTCSKPMEVPLLSAAEASHPDLCVVAAVPRPKQRLSSRVPTIGLWREDEWKEHYKEVATPPQQTPLWLVCALGTLIAAVLLNAGGMPGWVLILCVLIGTVLSCIFAVKGQTVGGKAGSAVSVVSYILLLLITIPLAAIGVLFIGCVACSAL